MFTKTPQNRLGIARAFAFACLLAMMFASLFIQPAAGQVGSIYYVTPTGTGDCSSWANACELQTAFAAAQPGSEIWVAAGTYMPTTGTDRTVSFVLKDGVAIYGGFTGTETDLSERDWEANVTILSGEIGVQNNPSDNSLHVVKGSGLTATAVLDGFNIRAGTANLSGENAKGGGMYLNNSSPSLANLTFFKNFAQGNGGALYILTGTPVFTDCSFIENTSIGGGGAVSMAQASPAFHGGQASRNNADSGGAFYSSNTSAPVTISSFTFAENTSTNGGAVRSVDSDLTMTDVQFLGNSSARYGGAIYANGYFETTITESVFQNNTAQENGGALYIDYHGGLTISNTVFYKNQSYDWGGAVYTRQTPTQITNSTFYRNIAADRGGGVLSVLTCAVIRNTIAWSNTAGVEPQVAGWSCTPNVAYSFMQGWANDPTKKIYGDRNPMFVSTIESSMDLRLLTASPAVDMGFAAFLPGGTLTDLDGNPRIAGSEVDLGAYEQQNPNHLPLLSQAVFEMPVINEDDSWDQGVLVADLIGSGGTDTDGDALGIAIISANEANGQWLYTNEAGIGWMDAYTPGSSSYGTVFGPNARLRFMPFSNWNGTLTGGLTFRLWDMSDAKKTGDKVNLSPFNTSNGSYSIDTGSVSITVRPINDPPTNSGSKNPYIIGAPVPGQVLTVVPGAWDDRYDSPDSTITLTYQWRIRDSGSTNFNDIPGATSQSYVPTEGDLGKHVAALVTASDNGVGEPPSMSTSVLSTDLTIVSHTDVISEGDVVTVSMDEDGNPTPFQRTLHALNNLTPVWGIGSVPAHGTASVSSVGVLTYTPTANFHGSDQFTVIAQLGDFEDSIVVMVEIWPRNDAPVATTLPSFLNQAVFSKTVNASHGVWNDSLDLSPGQITITQQWQRASISSGPWSAIAGETGLSYTPQAGDVGNYLRLWVTVTDNGEGLPSSMMSQAASLPALVTNAAPVIAEGSTLDVSSSPVRLHASDSDGNNLYWDILYPPSHGTASVDNSGKVTYSLYPNCTGMDEFTVRVTDGHSNDTILLRPPAGECRFYTDDSAVDGDSNGSSWHNAFTDLQIALTAARPGDEIWVAAGVYRPSASGDRYATFQLKTNVKVFGGFAGVETDLSQRDWVANPSILSGDLGAPLERNDNSYHVVTTQALNDTTVLDGFTIQDGNANHQTESAHSKGGGLFNKFGSNPILRNLVFYKNYGSYGGGMHNSASSPTIDHVTFRENESGQGGGMYNDGNSAPIITDSLFVGNKTSSSGGAMENDHSNPRLERVSFVGNTASSTGHGGAMHNDYSAPLMIDVTFRENLARHGGAMGGYQNTAILINVQFIANRAMYQGGAIHSGYSSNISVMNGLFLNNISDESGGAVSSMVNSNPKFYNSTFYGNQAPMASAVRGDYQSTPVLYNCILWTDQALTTGIVMSATLDHSIAKGALNNPEKGVYGDEAHNPRFAAPDFADFHLLAGSPAIDAGLNTWLPLDAADLDGDGNTTEPLPLDMDRAMRVRGGAVDLGAYEYVEPPAVIAVDDTIADFEEDSSQLLDVVANDSEQNDGELTITAVTQGIRGSVTIEDNHIRYEPHQDVYGTDSFSYTVANDDGQTDTASVYLTILPVNDYPEISPIGNMEVTVGETFTVDFTVDDAETEAGDLEISVQSSNTDLLPVANIIIGGSGSDRTLTITPTPDKTGFTQITVMVKDEEEWSVTTSFKIMVVKAGYKLYVPLITK